MRKFYKLVEEWRPIKDFEGIYEVSNFGRVKRLKCLLNSRYGLKRTVKEHFIKPKKLKSGYFEVHLFNNSNPKFLLVHRLVAFAFPEICGEYFEGAQINHKDENPENNCVWNLEWCTVNYNINYGSRIKKCAKKTSKPVLQYSLEGRFIKEWNSLSEIGKELKVKNISNISSCCLGRYGYKTAYGYKWKYKKKETN